MPGELTAKGKVVGLKQTRRALVQGAAAHVYLACDADPRLTDPLRALCAEKAIPRQQHDAAAAGYCLRYRRACRRCGRPERLNNVPSGIDTLCSVEK